MRIFANILLIAVLLAANSISTINFVCADTLYPCFTQNYYNRGNNENYLQIAAIENALFNRTYNNESVDNRLSRIERKLFRRTNTTESLSQRLETIMQNVNPAMFANIPLDGVKQLERRILGTNYTNDKIENRLSRLEQKVFGTIQSGELDYRYSKLVNSVGAYSASNCYYPYSTENNTQTSTKMKNALQNAFGAFGTVLTGYTPPVYNANPYDRYYHTNSPYYNPMIPFNSSNDYDNFYRNNNSFYNSFRNYGSSSGINILN